MERGQFEMGIADSLKLTPWLSEPSLYILIKVHRNINKAIFFDALYSRVKISVLIRL